MPGAQLTATRGEEKRTFDGGDAELLRAAVEKGWTIDGHTVVQRGEEYRAVPADKADLLEAAAAKGWSVRGGAADGLLPDIPLAADQAPVTLEAFAPDLAQKQGAIDAAGVQRDLQAQKQREAQQAALEREFGAGLTSIGGLANAAQTAGEGVSRGLSLGFDAPMAAAQSMVADAQDFYRGDQPEGTTVHSTRPVGEDPGSFIRPEVRQGIAQRAVINPGTAFVGDAAGSVLPAIATGGESLTARLAARAPTGILAQKAAGLGVRSAGALGLAGAVLEAPGLAGSLARVAAPAVKLAVEGGSQGLVQGATRAANDLWLSGDATGVWDYVRAGAGGAWGGGLLGTALGGAVGTGLGLRTLGKGGTMQLKGLGLLDDAAKPNVNPPAEPSLQYTPPAEENAVREAVAERLKLTPEQAAKQKNELYPKVRDKVNEFFDLEDRFREELDIAAKKRWVAKNATGPAPVEFGDVRAELGLTTPELEALAQQGAIQLDGKGGTGMVTRLIARLDDLENDLFVKSLKEPLTEGEVHTAIDQAKRYTDEVSKWAAQRNPYLHDLLDPKADQLRTFLVDKKVWPAALADMQEQTNSTWSTSIAARMDSDLSNVAGTLGKKSQWRKYENARKVNDAWLNGHFNGIGASPVEEQTSQAVNRWLNSSSDDALTRARIYGDKESIAAAERLNRLRREIQQDLGTVADINANTGADSAVAALARGQALGVLNQVPGASYVAEAAADRAREWAHKATVKGLEAVDRAAELRALVGKARPSVVGALAGSAEGGAKAAKAVDDYLRVALSGQPSEDEQQMLAVLEGSFGSEMAQAAAADMQRQREFLLQKQQEGADRASMRRYGAAALEPLDALERVSKGISTREDRETLQALNAPLYQRFVDKAVDNLSRKSTTYDDRLRASQALALPLDPSLEPENYAMHQQVAAQQSTMAAQQKAAQGESILTPGNQREPRMGKLLEE